ncbi:MAG: hypothetical protein U0U67_13205 [Chitinophagales bacterium]
MNYSLQEILANPALLNKVSDETLQDWIRQYPYVSLFHLYALKNKRNYTETELHKTAFHFHNREKLYFLLQTKDSAIIHEAKIGGIIPVIEEEILHEKPEVTISEIETIQKIAVDEKPIIEETIVEEETDEQPIIIQEEEKVTIDEHPILIDEHKEIETPVLDEAVEEIEEQKPVVEEKLSPAEIILRRIEEIKKQKENPVVVPETKEEVVEEIVEEKPIIEATTIEEKTDELPAIVEEEEKVTIDEHPILIDEHKAIETPVLDEAIEETEEQKPVVEEKLSPAEIILRRIEEIKKQRENPVVIPETKEEVVEEIVEEKSIVEETTIEEKTDEQPIIIQEDEKVTIDEHPILVDEHKAIETPVLDEAIEETEEQKPVVEEKLSPAEIILRRIEEIKKQKENTVVIPETKEEVVQEIVEEKPIIEEKTDEQPAIVEEEKVTIDEHPILVDEHKAIETPVLDEAIEETEEQKPVVEEKLSAAEIVLQRIQQIKQERENPVVVTETKEEVIEEIVEEKSIIEETTIEEKADEQPIIIQEEEKVTIDEHPILVDEHKEIETPVLDEALEEIEEQKPVVEEKLSAAEIVLQRIQQIKQERENPVVVTETKEEVIEEIVEEKPIVEETTIEEKTDEQPIIIQEEEKVTIDKHPILTDEHKAIETPVLDEAIEEIEEQKPIIEEKKEEPQITEETTVIETPEIPVPPSTETPSLVVQIIPEFTNIHDEISSNVLTISFDEETKAEAKEKVVSFIETQDVEVLKPEITEKKTDTDVEIPKPEMEEEIITEEIKTEPVIEIETKQETTEQEVIEEQTEITEKPVEPAIQDTTEPHTFVEWLKLLDGKLQIQTTQNNQNDNWIEIPRYEVEQSLENKKAEKSLEELAAEIKKETQNEEKIKIQPVFEEGEIDLFNEIDEEVTKIATESVSFKNDMMTETLANIYVKQGKIDKALDIYNTLLLKFPEKSAYFASLIENLKKSE